ncbi:TPA: hypothetical protein DEP58_04810 [Patescibacteria group bacterium]|uniref:Uncharacterized protein n=1 Tax=Candidatus Magasanikbacteria bacterium GW2011_GWE2_42_7 TaxID=1619052 RepID=A0A0G1BAQ3_9BACT|nr:MAG: hypothetical protein UV42_C0053G0001 [Candidatus Magasanikbacteria bacterium GW2011_GWE2_42_7]HCC05586.1 hypothetical protein [Patescibacteria group bacterium]
MSIGNWEEDRRFAELFDPKFAHKYYKNPEEHLSQMAAIIERNAVCGKCGKKEMKVVSVTEKKMVCKSCGHTPE